MPAIPYAVLGYGRNREELQDVIDATTFINVGQIRRGRAPLWWDSPARYAREEQATLPGVERIQTAEELHALGYGDCDDHAPALAASLRVAGYPARAVVIESPGVGYHVVVVTRGRDGERRVIDPSARRGMLAGERPGARMRRIATRASAAFRRGQALANKALAMNPASAAARAIASEARRQLRIAQEPVESETDEREDDERDERSDQTEPATEVGMVKNKANYEALLRVTEEARRRGATARDCLLLVFAFIASDIDDREAWFGAWRDIISESTEQSERRWVMVRLQLRREAERA